MWVWTIVGLLCAVVTVTSAIDRGEWWEVNIAQGPVRGHKDPTEDLYVFYNIPYATAPTGEHKFKAPLPAPKWTEPYDAIDKGTICPQSVQFPLMPSNLNSQENCLIANVLVPDTEEKKLSVLVYVHGGGFLLGYGNWLTLKNLMKPKDIIVVTFNYRLGIHGFLCLGTEDVPGNAGMKDQVALLHWVRQNIASFGGNPNDVTIAGDSAGSTSVDLLMISKAAEGLFHKVIPESGSNLAAFAMQGDPVSNAKEYAKKLNFTNTDDIFALEQFYKNLSYDNMRADWLAQRKDSIFLFSPCLERDGSNGAFLTKSPLNILKSGDYVKVPLLYGFSNMEGLMRIEFFDLGWKDKMNEKFSDFLPADLIFKSEAEKEEDSKKVKSFYFGDKPIDKGSILKYIDYFSDVLFVYSSLRALKLHLEAGHKEIYLYEYSFVDDDTPVIPYTNVRGAAHCAQTMAIFDGKNFIYALEDDISQDYRNMKKVMRELWHNFIKTSKPVPDRSSLPAWPPVDADGTPHMSLRQTLELRGVLYEEMVQFWDDIYKNYYREPLAPSQPPLKHHTDL